MTQAEWTALAGSVISILSAVGSGFWAWRIKRQETNSKQTSGWEAQYRRDYEALKTQLAEAQTRERAQQEEETATLREQVAELSRSLGLLQTELGALRSDYTALRADYNRLRTAHARVRLDLAAVNAHLDEWRRAVSLEPAEIADRIKSRVSPAPPPERVQRLPPSARQSLVALLCADGGLDDARLATVRAALPPPFLATVRETGVLHDDLAALVAAAARAAPPLLTPLLDACNDALGGPTAQGGQALLAWRATWSY